MTGIVFSNVLLPVMPAILQSGTIYLSTNTGPENYAGAGCNPNFFAVAGRMRTFRRPWASTRPTRVTSAWR